MKTSARNEFEGRVTRITGGTVNDEVELTLPGNHRLVATITRRSTEELGLAVGSDAFAFVKASTVMIATRMDRMKLSTRNQLTGTVSRVAPGSVSAEVVVEVPATGQSGATLEITAVVTLDSVTQLNLTPGAKATAIFKASSVILGVRT